MIAPLISHQPVGSLLVFADDWGRHPSSCQHLVKHLLDRYPVTWVNSIGTRAPRLDRATLRRAIEKLGHWAGGRRHTLGDHAAGDPAQSVSLPSGLTVLSPGMWPWFRSSADRRLNRWLLQRQLTPRIQQMPQPVVGLTTLPITADLPDALPVDRWVYYCVDDFSAWPGLDGHTLQRMDRQMIARADSLVAVSEHLRTMISTEGKGSELLTHGVDLEFWQTPSSPSVQAEVRLLLQGLPRPLIVFWGVIDRRMCTSSILKLSHELTQGTILLVGPQQNPDPQLLAPANVVTLPPQPMDRLPSIADHAAVLMMPYADLPVTQAMQPLKLKEYLATGRPVVVNRLPSTMPWNDCLDAADCPEQFIQLVHDRLQSGLTANQKAARNRLDLESWAAKADCLDRVLHGYRIDDGCGPQDEGIPGRTTDGRKLLLQANSQFLQSDMTRCNRI